MSSVGAILPLAFVMIAGPQILSSFFLATSERWWQTSLAYVAGAAISVTAVASIAFLVAKGAQSAAESGGESTVNRVIDSVVLVLLTVLIVRTFLKRAESKPPTWMAKLQAATPKFSFLLGLALLGIFPTDILTATTVGLHVGREHEPWWHILTFVGLTLLLLGAPALGVLLLGRHAKVVLPKVRDWMTNNSWVVSEIVLIFFVGITINSLVKG